MNFNFDINKTTATTTPLTGTQSTLNTGFSGLTGNTNVPKTTTSTGLTTFSLLPGTSQPNTATTTAQGFTSTLSFNKPAMTTVSLVTPAISAKPTTSVAATTFSFPVTPSTTAAATTTTTSTASPALNFTFTGPSPNKSAFSLTPQTSTTTITPKTDGNKTTFSIPTSTAPASTTSSTGFSLSTSAVTTTTATVQIPAPVSMTYNQIEDLLNKWTTELAEQERLFLSQVTQLNAWDKLLADNCSKLMKLHSTIEKVQQQQKKINYDLEFILSQKKELENALIPLEKEYSSSNYHPDVQRERMYHTAENIDAQIKKMSEDVKETIEHVNDTARSQEKMHPIVLIGRVLNAQMNSLQWVDENSAQLQSQIESMSRYLDNIKRETERAYIPFQ